MYNCADSHAHFGVLFKYLIFRDDLAFLRQLFQDIANGHTNLRHLKAERE